jgi:hypothetical protein
VRVMHPADRPQASTVLARVLGVDIRDAVDPAGLSATVADSAVVTAALTALADEKIELAQFSLGQPSLDEVFLALTGRTSDAEKAEKEEEVAA